MRFMGPLRARVSWGLTKMDEVDDDVIMTAYRLLRWHRKRHRKCRAKTRKGTPCQRRPYGLKRRCPLHGGLSTGPQTPEGRQRVAEAERRRWAAWRAARAGDGAS